MHLHAIYRSNDMFPNLHDEYVSGLQSRATSTRVYRISRDAPYRAKRGAFRLRCSMKKVIIFLPFFAALVSGCPVKKTDAYEAIKNSGLAGSALYERITAFEKEHPEHFESKLDLGSYCFVSENYGEAWKYLLKAESLLASVKGVSAQHKALLCALLSGLYAADGDEERAADYAKKAYETPECGAEYGYLYAKIRLLRDDKSEALALFDKTYALYPERISADELRAYIYLLADAGQFQKCGGLLEPYFETGGFFPGFGVFASGVYEKIGDTEKAVLCAFLDYEYAAGGKEKDDAFLTNLQSVEALLPAGGDSPALESIRALFDMKREVPEASSFFVSDYIRCKAKLLRGDISSGDLSSLLQLEKYFSRFPSYYWSVWLAVRALQRDGLNDWIPVLEKTIALAPSSFYASRAKIELASCIGLPAGEAENVLVPAEVKAAIDGFMSSGDDEKLSPLYALLNLPDCAYVYAGVDMAKRSAEDPIVRAAFMKKKLRAAGRLQDRLAFILS